MDRLPGFEPSSRRRTAPETVPRSTHTKLPPTPTRVANIPRAPSPQRVPTSRSPTPTRNGSRASTPTRTPTSTRAPPATKNASTPTSKKGVRFSFDTKGDVSRQSREPPSTSDRGSTNQKTFQEALTVLDDIVKRDEARYSEKQKKIIASTTRNNGREDPPQFELEDSREMNRILTEQLRILQKKVNGMQLTGMHTDTHEIEVMTKRYNTMKGKLTTVTGVLEEVTLANKSLHAKYEELKRKVRGNDAPTKTEQDMYGQDREGLIGTVKTLKEKIDVYKEEKMATQAVQARKDAKHKELEKSLAEATDQICELKIKNTDQISDLQAKYTVLELELVTTKDKLQDAKQAFELGEKEKIRMTKQISDLFSDLDDMTEDKKGLIARNEKLESRISLENLYQQEKSDQYEAQANLMAGIRARKESLQEKVDNLNTRLKDAVKKAKECEDMPYQVEEMKRKMDVQEASHRSKMAVMQTEVSKLKALNRTLEMESAGLRIRLDGAHKEIKVSRDANIRLHEEASLKQMRKIQEKEETSFEAPKSEASKSEDHILFNNMDQHINEVERLNKILTNEKEALHQKYVKCCAEYDEVNEANCKLATKNKELIEVNLELEKEATHNMGTLNGKAAMISALARKIEELQYQRTDLMEAKTALETQMTVEKNSIIMANTNIAELEARIVSYEFQVDDLKDEIKELNSENERLKKFESQTYDVKDEVKAKQETIKSLGSKIEELENEKLLLRETVKKAKAEVEAHKNTIAASSNQIADLGGLNACHEAKITELQEIVEAKKLELESVEKTYEEHVTKIEEKMKNADDSWQTKYDECNKEWQVKFSNANAEWQETMDDVINEYQIKHDDASDEWKSKLDDTNAQWQSKYDTSVKENSLLTEKCDVMKTVYDSKARENEAWEELQGKFDQLQSQFGAEREMHAEVFTTNEELEDQVKTQVEQIMRMNDHSVKAAEKQNERMADLKQRTTILQERCTRLENANAELQAKDEASRTEVKSLIARYKCTAIEVEQMENQFTNLSKEIISSKGKKGDTNVALASIITALNQQVEHFKKERRQLYESQATIEAKATVHRNSMVAATTQIAELEAEKDALQKELDELKVKLEDTTEEIENAHQSVAVTESALKSLGKLNKERQLKVDGVLELNKKLVLTNTSLSSEQSEMRAAHSELLSKYESCCSELEEAKDRINTQESFKRSSAVIASTQLAELNAKNTSLERSLEAAKEELQDAHSEMDSSRKEMDESMSRYKAKLDAMTQLNVECQSKIYDLEQTVAKHDYSVDPNEFKIALATCQQQLADQTQSNEVYKSLIDQLNQLNEGLKVQVSSQKDDIEALKESEADLTAQAAKLTDVQDKLSRISDENSKMKESLRSLTNKIKEVTQDRINARDEGKFLLARIEELSLAKNKVEKTLKDWKRVSKGKMRELTFRNNQLNTSNQEKAKEVERLRNLISRRR